MISEGGTLDHQTTAHGERAHRPLKEHVIARAIRSTVDGETGESMAQHAFEMMQIQTIERRIDAVNALQLNCGKEDRSRTPIQNGTPNFRLCGLSKRFHIHTYFHQLSLEFNNRQDFVNDLRLFLLRAINPSTPIRVRQEHLPQIDESTITDYTLFRCSFNSWVDEREYEDLIRSHPNWQTSGKPRYDDVILRNHDNTVSFGRVIRLLSCRIQDKEFQLALVCEYKWVGRHYLSGMPLLQGQEQLSFILTENIARSCYIQPDPVDDGFYHVNDLAEADLFLRFQNLS
ncbi:hypothetical protein BT69DRAFT_1283035 [Atractiella rhizophila]|nr:hypothetical protein BT69DRAFT_1283035 [Atractiella rhizophila]